MTPQEVSVFCPQMVPFWTVAIFIVGSCIGSFLNVCIWRIPRGESVVFPDSHCPKCDHKLTWYENIPYLSWLCLQGKCSNCKEPISIRYFLVELLTGCLFAAAWLKVNWTHEPQYTVIPYLVMIMLIITTVFIDAKHFIIPDLTTVPAMIFGLVFALIVPRYWGGIDNRFIALCRSMGGLLTGIAFFAIFAIIFKQIFKKDGLGWGDVKYLGAVGACLGFLNIFYTVLFGSIFGCIVGLFFLIVRKKKHKRLPFGPYLAVGTLIGIFAGNQLLIWYLNFASWLKQ